MDKNISRKIGNPLKKMRVSNSVNTSATEEIRGCNDRSRWTFKNTLLRLVYQNHDLKALRPVLKTRTKRIVDRTARQKGTR